ncbi:MAG: hypothetical protein AAGF50_10815, partial [Pseudomonadota bacterium]
CLILKVGQTGHVSVQNRVIPFAGLHRTRDAAIFPQAHGTAPPRARAHVFIAKVDWRKEKESAFCRQKLFGNNHSRWISLSKYYCINFSYLKYHFGSTTFEKTHRRGCLRGNFGIDFGFSDL